MLNLFLAPFQFPFMVNAIAISIVVAIPCALLSVFLVLKGWALMGDAMSHAVFPGVVLAYIIGIPFAIGAFIAGLLCAVTTGFLDDNSDSSAIPSWGLSSPACLAPDWCCT